jgi:hypothetical protein
MQPPDQKLRIKDKPVAAALRSVVQKAGRRRNGRRRACRTDLAHLGALTREQRAGEQGSDEPSQIIEPPKPTVRGSPSRSRLA